MKPSSILGKVYLVGAGPGAADLITVRGAKLLEQADIVFHDALVEPEMLELCKHAVKVPVGKRCGKLSSAQHFINKRLVDAAQQYNIIVRLKGGDPMLFGRADEEIQALKNVGIAVDVVPGITAALAGAASIQQSLTLRGISRSVAFVTFGATDTSGSPLSITALNLAVWNPVIAPTGGYQYADNVRASGGQAYWAKPNQGVVLNPRGKLWSQSQAYSIPLTAGWNMVGSVYLQDIAWSAVQVKYQGQTLPIAQAGEIVRNYAWGFNSATGSYVLVQAGGALKSGRGYWVKAVKSCDLVLPAPTTKAASAQAVVNAAANALQVIARLGATMDTDNFLPLDAGAKPAYVEKPPYLAEHAVVSIVPTESVQMPADLQAGTGVIHAFDVTTAVADANVVVEFPSMASLGRRYQATLVDLATGARKSLAQSGSYTYNTGATAAPRQFVLVLSKAAANSSLLISAVHNTGRAAGSMSFSYSMSAQATVRAQIVSATGAVVRTLSSGRAAAQGANSLLWDTRDNRGIAVPAGSYLLKLTGTDDGGRSATAVLPVVLVR
jgi:uroporphyrin-III C-methyltransferase